MSEGGFVNQGCMRELGRELQCNYHGYYLNQGPFQHLSFQVNQQYDRIYFPREIPARQLRAAGMRAQWETAATRRGYFGCGNAAGGGAAPRGWARARGKSLQLRLPRQPRPGNAPGSGLGGARRLAPPGSCEPGRAARRARRQARADWTALPAARARSRAPRTARASGHRTQPRPRGPGEPRRARPPPR